MVERALLGQHRFVAGIKGGEFAPQLGARALSLLRPLRALFGADQGRLLSINLDDQRGQQLDRPASEVVFAQLKFVNSFNQHRQAVGAAERCDKGIKAALWHLVAQEPRREVADVGDRKLREATLKSLLDEAT